MPRCRLCRQLSRRAAADGVAAGCVALRSEVERGQRAILLERPSESDASSGADTIGAESERDEGAAPLEQSRKVRGALVSQDVVAEVDGPRLLLRAENGTHDLSSCGSADACGTQLQPVAAQGALEGFAEAGLAEVRFFELEVAAACRKYPVEKFLVEQVLWRVLLFIEQDRGLRRSGVRKKVNCTERFGSLRLVTLSPLEKVARHPRSQLRHYRRYQQVQAQAVWELDDLRGARQTLPPAKALGEDEALACSGRLATAMVSTFLLLGVRKPRGTGIRRSLVFVGNSSG